MRSSHFIAALCLLLAGCATTARPPAASSPEERPLVVSESRHTTLGQYVTARQAHEMIAANPDSHVLLDCRPPEAYYYAGHPEGAVNIPYAFMTYRLEPGTTRYVFKKNPQFLARVRERFSTDHTIFVMSRSGLRSARAVNVLAENGYTKVYNVVDGFSGGSGASGGGWKNSGLPVTAKLDPELIYVSEQK